MKYLTILLIAAAAFASLNYDLNQDGQVNKADFAIFASGYNSSYDANDLLPFAAEWLMYESWCEGAPVAGNLLLRYAADGEQEITLPASGYDSISITSLPATAVLRQASGGAAIESVPSELTSSTIFVDITGAVNESFWYAATKTGAAPCVGTSSGIVRIIYAKPTAENISVNIEAGVGERLPLAGETVGAPKRFVVESYSAELDVIDPFAGPLYKTPWTMLREADELIAGSATTGTYNLTYKTSDEQFTSEPATAAVSITANSQDAVFFDGDPNSYITLPNYNNQFDLVDGRAIWLFIKTTQRTGCILRKRGSGAGYELWVVNHVPTLRLYDAAGELAAEYKFDDETYGYSRLDKWWVQIGFNYQQKEAEEAIELLLSVNKSTNDGLIVLGAQSQNIQGVPDNDYSNSEPVIIMQGVRGGFDALRFYNGYDPGSMNSGLITTQNRYQAGSATLMVSPATITFQFRGLGYLSDSTSAHTFSASGDVSRVPSDFYNFGF